MFNQDISWLSVEAEAAADFKSKAYQAKAAADAFKKAAADAKAEADEAKAAAYAAADAN
jgi:hypothetical protein